MNGHLGRMPLSDGERLGPYEIQGRIGAGGIGEVYQARDIRLGRDVAIKVSAAEFSERFEHEARAIAPLNHPSSRHRPPDRRGASRFEAPATLP